MKTLKSHKDSRVSFSSIFFDSRKKTLLALFFITLIVLEFIFLVGLKTVFNVDTAALIVIGIFILILGSIGGAYLSVIIDLPNISHKFDAIKNDIALKKIKSPADFGERLLKLMCNYYNYTFFTIDQSFCKILKTDYIFSDLRIIDRFNPDQYEIMLKKTQETEDIIYFGKVEIENKSFYLYLMPVWFGQQWLGYIGIYTNTRLRRIFLNFLSEFENDYIDDQLVHVLNYKGILNY